jgi:uncharacterized Zn finger protein
MCKHVAAVLYGVGARLDDEPQLLFVLRGVNENELLCDASRGVPLSRQTPNAAALLDEGDVAALFGLEMVEPASAESTIVVSKRPRQTTTPNESKALSGKKASAARKRKPSRVPRLKPLKKPTRRGTVTKTRGSN